jgi:hypothetical protein
MLNHYPDKVTMFQPNIYYEKIMETFGGNAEYVERISGIKPAIFFSRKAMVF